MLFKEMEIKNFRLFIDEKISFAENTADNTAGSVTVFHGENGSGKTTLLQAFIFAFYGEDNINLDNRDLLLNKSVELNMENGDREKIQVTLLFEHNHRDYKLIRTLNVEKYGTQLKYIKSYLSILIKDDDGNWNEPQDRIPINIIESIFPQSLSSYFLFDGERIKNLGDNSKIGKSDLRTAVARVLSLDNLYNAKNHLKIVLRKIEAEYGQESGTNYLKAIEDQEEKISGYENSLIDIDKSITYYDDEVKKYKKMAQSFEETKNLAGRKENIKSSISNGKIKQGRYYVNFFKAFSRDSYSFFAKQLFEETKKYLCNLDLTQGFIEGIDGHAIDQILERKSCICGTDFAEGDNIYLELMKLKQYLPPQYYGVMVNNFIDQIAAHSNNSNDLVQDLNDLASDFFNEATNLSKLNNTLNEITAALENHSIEAVRETEAKQKQFENKLRNSLMRIGAIKENIKEGNEKIKKLEKERDATLLRNARNKIISDRAEVAKQLIEYFENFLIEQESFIREHLQDLVDKIFKEVIHKDYRLIFNDKYEFDVLDRNNVSVPLSEGEKQITSISFITGLVNMAKDEKINARFADKTNYDASEIYPVVMDSPFGSLDQEHRRKISLIVPQLSDQTILFSSSSQWKGEVENAMREKVGAEYYLKYKNEIVNGISKEYTKIERV